MKEILLQRQDSLQGRELKKQAAAQEAVGLWTWWLGSLQTKILAQMGPIAFF